MSAADDLVRRIEQEITAMPEAWIEAYPDGSPKVTIDATVETIAHRIARLLGPLEFYRMLDDACAKALSNAAENMDLPGCGVNGYYGTHADAGYREAEQHAREFLLNEADLLTPSPRRHGVDHMGIPW